MRHSLVAHLIRRRCLHGKVAFGLTCRWPGTCVTWLEPCTSWLGQPLCRHAAWGSPPRGWRGSWKSTPCSSPCAHHWLGTCQPTAPGPWANEWPGGTFRRQHCCGYGPAVTRRLHTVWWTLPCLSPFLSLFQIWMYSLSASSLVLPSTHPLHMALFGHYCSS